MSLILIMSLGAISSLSAKDSSTLVFDTDPAKATYERGKKVYETYCSGCHGLKGDGAGPAATFLNPKPRNFITAEYKFTSGPSGSLPTDADLYKVITNGLHGSSMPTWRLLADQDRLAVVSYLKAFAPDTWKNNTSTVTAISEDPFIGRREEAIARGERAYHGMASCISCHAAFISPEKINEARESYQMSRSDAFRENLYESEIKPATDGSLVKPPDFTWDALKIGSDLESLYLVVANGIGGTAMPSWKGILPEEDLWGLAYYIQSLAEKKPKLITDAVLAERAARLVTMESQRKVFEENMKLQAKPEGAAQ
jgi:mono/diheme cytochrome c family protein